MKSPDVELAHNFLESIVPEFPEVERTEEDRKAYEEMIYDSYFKGLSRKERRKYMNSEFKFSKQIKKKLNNQ